MTRFCTCSGLDSPVDLSRKRKQVDKVSCMTCGRPLVDGIRPPSASMPSTASLELTNFINPDLTWKRVTKGFRSAARRSRRPTRSLNVDVQQDDKGTKREELSGSESEKLGVAVLERRFSDKIAHIPIKKRRILLWPPSPPRSPSPYWEESLSSQHQTSSQQHEDSDRSMDSKCASGQWCSDSVSNWEMRACNGPVAIQFGQGFENAFVNEKLCEVTNGKFGYTEDFSGIALLAAAACNNSISDDARNVEEGPIADELLTPEGTDSYRSATPSERTMTSSETGNLIIKESAHEDSIDGSTVQDNSVVLSQNFHDKTEREAGKSSASMKDNRLHWDLNTVMEAWELPCDDLNIFPQRNGSEGIPADGVHSEKREKPESSVHRDPEHALELLKYSTADPEVLTRVFSKDKSLDNYPCPGSDLISGRPLSEEKINTSPTNIIIRTREDCCGTSAIQLSQMASIESVHLGEHDAVFLVPAVSEKVVCQINSIQSKEDTRKTFELPDDETCPTVLVSTVTCQTSADEYSVSKSEKAGPPHLSPEHENLSALVTTFEGQPVVAVDVEKKQDKAPPADATPMDSSLHVELNEFMPKPYECFGQVALEDPIDDVYGSDVSHSVNGHLVGIEKLTLIQAGYESPFEDGELRESVSYSWEENEVEGEVEGEPECVDYDSDNRDKDDFDVANYCTSEIGSDSCHNDTDGNLAEKHMQSGRADALKESSHSVTLKKFSVQDQLPDGCECSTNRTGEADNVSTPKVLAADSMHGLDVDAASTGEAELGATRGELLSHIEGSSCSDALHRQDNVYMQRNRSSYDSCFQAGRVFGSKKYLGTDRAALQMQDGSQGDVQWVDSSAGYWDSRNHRQTGYRQGAGYPRPRNIISNTVAKNDYRDQRRSMNYSSKGVYRPFIRRSSPADSDDGYIVHRRMVAARDNSHIRSRGRSGIYQHGVRRGPREEYHGPMSDYPASVRLSHYSARSERSFSPVLSSGASFSRPRGKSRSRSRTRSPLRWHLQRERNMGVRHLSKSPDFRSKARMERIRIPFQKSNFAADDEDVFMSPPRSRCSPESNSRWIDDRNIVATRFRERKSPGRCFGRSQRFDSGGSPGRMKSDEYHGKYEMIHRVRRRDTSGVVRQFRYDAEDSFEVHNTRNNDCGIRSTDRRDNTPRSAREERGPFRYNN